MAATYADQAFERLYARYGREVYRYALALLRNPAEAEDVTQTTFLNAYRALRAGERPLRPHNWLITIAHNVCRSRVRFAMRRPKEVPLDDVVEQLAVPETERPNIRELLRTIRRLPFNQRAAITMRELEGRSYVDIAETLGVTVPAAEALIGRARRTLREQAARFRALALLPSSAVGKVAALLVVGAIGAGVGVATGTDPQPRSTPVVRPAAAAAALPERLATGNAAAVAVTHPRPKSAGRPVAGQMTAQRPQIAADETTGAATTATAPAATPAAGGPATTSVVETAETTAAATVGQAITTAVSQLPTVTTPPVTTPVATVPPVTVTVPSVTVPTVTLP